MFTSRCLGRRFLSSLRLFSLSSASLKCSILRLMVERQEFRSSAFSFQDFKLHALREAVRHNIIPTTFLSTNIALATNTTSCLSEQSLDILDRYPIKRGDVVGKSMRSFTVRPSLCVL